MEVDKQRMSIINTCTVSKRGRRSVQYMVLLLKSDVLADSKDYSTPCTTAWPAVQSSCRDVSEKRGLFQNFRHWPWASRDSGGWSSAIIAPWQTTGQTVVNVWRGKPLESRGPRTARTTSSVSNVTTLLHAAWESAVVMGGRETPPSTALGGWIAKWVASSGRVLKGPGSIPPLLIHVVMFGCIMTACLCLIVSVLSCVAAWCISVADCQLLK